jgi:hypothetical protein
MYSIQDPVLENLLGFLHDKKEFVFLDTSRPLTENVQSFVFILPLYRILCRVGDVLEKYFVDFKRCLKIGH